MFGPKQNYLSKHLDRTRTGPGFGTTALSKQPISLKVAARLKPEDQWSCKRSPDYFPGINTTVKRENGATSIF